VNRNDNDALRPEALRLRRGSRVLEITWPGEEPRTLAFEYLRVYSLSAEVRGHGAGQETLQTGKKHVGVETVRPVGHYAIQLVFDDGHDTGIYSWSYLRELCDREAQWWQDYLDRLAAAGASRDPDTQVLHFQP
jgi:DUF971 family protein